MLQIKISICSCFIRDLNKADGCETNKNTISPVGLQTLIAIPSQKLISTQQIQLLILQKF